MVYQVHRCDFNSIVANPYDLRIRTRTLVSDHKLEEEKPDPNQNFQKKTRIQIRPQRRRKKSGSDPRTKKRFRILFYFYLFLYLWSLNTARKAQFQIFMFRSDPRPYIENRIIPYFKSGSEILT